ncbi:2-hydroxyacid dehydrogenase [Roseomonas sp. NAR14]|uniref:2-hydroxyacid dehydrogenase n=1 Tax=Roseomonas acroporae TaxID=2937791 RepID=A0A9X1YC94_9PROT|nr:2-hydroxyacid dehydrogenase [Roseomonas acroporae]MCK8787764.1 2-hydroxyacid dehydrogenase [Roseomonas acroporae]
MTAAAGAAGGADAPVPASAPPANPSSGLPFALATIPLRPAAVAALGALVTLLPAGTATDPRAVVVVTNGSTGLSDAAMAAMPALRLIACFGAGHENVDLDAAARRGIVVTNAPGANAATVADHALGLMLAVARGIVAADRGVRAGGWAELRAVRPTLDGARLGVIGLGAIGEGIARRGAAFGMSVGYHTRRPRPDQPWRHEPSLTALARESDFLVAACPGGPATRHLVNAEVLAALGPEGFLVNIARGSVVDTAALVAALAAGTIAGAALDVVEGEPVVPPALLAQPRLVITPHMAGRSPAAERRQIGTLVANVTAVLAGRPAPDAVLPGRGAGG